MKIKQNIIVIICAITVYSLIILHHGYELGRNDHEQAAYGYFLNDNSLYANDFYIQSLSQQVPNERTFYGKFISFTGNNIPLFSFIWHFVFTIILLLGVRKISTLFINNEWFSIILPFVRTNFYFHLICHGKLNTILISLKNPM